MSGVGVGKLFLGGSVLTTSVGVGIGGVLLDSSKEERRTNTLSPVRESRKEVTHITTQGARRCEVFLVVDDKNKKLSRFDWEAKKASDPKSGMKYGNKGFWEALEKACNKDLSGSESNKIYISKGSYDGMWNYFENKQKNYLSGWTVV